MTAITGRVCARSFAPRQCSNVRQAFEWREDLQRFSSCGKLHGESQAEIAKPLKLRRNFFATVNNIGQTHEPAAVFSPLNRCHPFQNMVNVVLW
jgi:hypothetical protein